MVEFMDGAMSCHLAQSGDSDNSVDKFLLETGARAVLGYSASGSRQGVKIAIQIDSTQGYQVNMFESEFILFKYVGSTWTKVWHVNTVAG